MNVTSGLMTRNRRIERVVWDVALRRLPHERKKRLTKWAHMALGILYSDAACCCF